MIPNAKHDSTSRWYADASVWVQVAHSAVDDIPPTIKEKLFGEVSSEGAESEPRLK